MTQGLQPSHCPKSSNSPSCCQKCTTVLIANLAAIICLERT
jgi:hypothetical protein